MSMGLSSICTNSNCECKRSVVGDAYVALRKGRPSPGRLRLRLTPYVGCHVCMSVCLSPGLSDICVSSKCERKRPGLGRP